MTSPVGGLGAAAAGSSSTTAAAGAAPAAEARRAVSSALSPDAFLDLLVAQLRYQNPMSPTDPAEHLAQLASFAQVERMDAVLSATEQVLGWQRATAGQAMVGAVVTGDGQVGPVTGRAVGLQIAGSTPTLVLEDGSTLPVASVTSVTPAAGPGAPSTSPGTAPGTTGGERP